MSSAGLRHRPVRDVLVALDIDHDDPRCPRCGAAWLVHDADPWAGVSVRCARDECRLGEWAWPEYLTTADLRGGFPTRRTKRSAARHRLARRLAS